MSVSTGYYTFKVPNNNYTKEFFDNIYSSPYLMAEQEHAKY